MKDVLRAEIRKLKRPSLVLVIFPLLSLLSFGMTILVFLNNKGRGKTATSNFDGSYISFSAMGLFLGLIALTVFASQSANEGCDKAMMSPNSLARSNGMVMTATRPALTTANQRQPLLPLSDRSGLALQSRALPHRWGSGFHLQDRMTEQARRR